MLQPYIAEKLLIRLEYMLQFNRQVKRKKNIHLQIQTVSYSNRSEQQPASIKYATTIYSRKTTRPSRIHATIQSAGQKKKNIRLQIQTVSYSNRSEQQPASIKYATTIYSRKTAGINQICYNHIYQKNGGITLRRLKSVTSDFGGTPQSSRSANFAAVLSTSPFAAVLSTSANFTAVLSTSPFAVVLSTSPETHKVAVLPTSPVPAIFAGTRHLHRYHKLRRYHKLCKCQNSIFVNGK
jgi:hypothetical protein